jgi:PAS domain S-box-containing protein
LFAHSPDAILVIDSQGAIIEANPQAVRLFGYTRAELLGRQIEVLLPEHFRKGHSEHRQSYMRNPHTDQFAKTLLL